MLFITKRTINTATIQHKAQHNTTQYEHTQCPNTHTLQKNNLKYTIQKQYRTAQHKTHNTTTHNNNNSIPNNAMQTHNVKHTRAQYLKTARHVLKKTYTARTPH